MARSGTGEQIPAVHNSQFPGLRSEGVSAAKIWLSPCCLWHLWQAAPEFLGDALLGLSAASCLQHSREIPRIRKGSTCYLLLPVGCATPLHYVPNWSCKHHPALPHTHPSHPSQPVIQGIFISNPLLGRVGVSRWELQWCCLW